MDRFIARYEENGRKKSVIFDKSKYTKEQAELYLKENGIKNFFFFFETYEPVMLDENTVSFSGEVGFDISVSTILPYLKKGNDFSIDSYGGNLKDGLQMYDLIKSKYPETKMSVLGVCASAATLPFLAAKIENRTITQNSEFLIHNPWTEQIGDDAEFRKTADDLQTAKNNLAKIYALETGRTFEEMLNLMSEERFLSAEECGSFGFIKNNSTQINNNDNNNNNETLKNMEEKEAEKKVSALIKMFDTIKSAFNPVKNIVLQDVNGVNLDFGADVESADQISVGASVTADGQPASGDFVIADNTYTCENGVVTAITPIMDEPENAEVVALKEENAKLQEDLNAAITEKETINAKLEDVSAKMATFEAEITAFKAKFSTEKASITTPETKKEVKEQKKFTLKQSKK